MSDLFTSRYDEKNEKVRRDLLNRSQDKIPKKKAGFIDVFNLKAELGKQKAEIGEQAQAVRILAKRTQFHREKAIKSVL